MNNLSIIDPNRSIQGQHGIFRSKTDLNENPIPIELQIPLPIGFLTDDKNEQILQPLIPAEIDYAKIPNYFRNDTHFFKRIHFNPSFQNVILLITLILFAVWVILLNCLTIVGLWKTHKKGHVVDLYLVNLAFSDVLLGILILPLISVIIILGYFPFSSYLCDAWVFLDYYLIVASSYGFAALMCNYLWMIRWPQTFPMDFKHHILALILTWIAVNVSWTPPFFNDRLSTIYQTGACGFSISKNHYFTFYIGFTAFYIPLGISLICGIWSLAVLKKESGLAIFSVGKVEINQHDQNYRLDKRTGPDSLQRFRKNSRRESIISRVIQSALFRNNYNSRKQTEYIYKTAKAHYPLVVACFLLFIICRSMFYLYFGIGAFAHHLFPPDISNGIYWLMHSNAAISPILHFWFDPELRIAINQILGIKSKPKKTNKKKAKQNSAGTSSVKVENSIIEKSKNHPHRHKIEHRNTTSLDESGILPSISISIGNDSSGRSLSSYEHFLYSKNKSNCTFKKKELADTLERPSSHSGTRF